MGKTSDYFWYNSYFCGEILVFSKKIWRSGILNFLLRLPIEATEIDPKNINGVDTNKGFKEALEGFCKYLNIETDIELEI